MKYTNDDYLRVLNKMRSNYQNNGNAMINTMDDSTAVGEELSSFAYMNLPTPSMPEKQKSSIQEYKESRNGWQRTIDTVTEFSSNVTEGVFNVLDDIGDFVIGLAGEIGSWLGEDTKWAEDAISYDWVAQANEFLYTGVIDFLNPKGREKVSKIFSSPEDAREITTKRHASSFVSDASEDFQNAYNCITTGIGELLPSLALATVTGGSSLGAQAAAQGGMAFVKAAGQSTESALNEGADFHGAARYGVTRGTISGAITAATVGIGGTVVAKGGQGLVSKGAQKIGEKVGTVFSNSATAEVIASKTTEIFMRAGIDANSAGAQSLLDPVLKQITYDSEAIQKAYGSSEAIQNSLANMGNAMVQAGITSAILSTGKEVASGFKAGSFDEYKENYFVNKLTASDAIKAKKYTEEYDKLCKEYYEKSGINTGKLLSVDEFEKLSIEYSNKIEKLSSKYKVDEILERVNYDNNNFEGTTAEKYDFSIRRAQRKIDDSLTSRATENTLPKTIMHEYLKKSGFDIHGYYRKKWQDYNANKSSSAETNSTETNSNGNSTFTSSDGKSTVNYDETSGEATLTTPYNPSSPINIVPNKNNSVSLSLNEPHQIAAILEAIRHGNQSRLPDTFTYNGKTRALSRENLSIAKTQLENKDNALFGLKDGESALKYLNNNYTEEEIARLNNSNTQLITTGEELKNYIYGVFNNYDKVKARAIIGRITNKTAMSLKKDTGIDFSNFSLAYNKSYLKHIENKHIVNENESLPLTYNDLLKFPYIMENYDSAIIANNEKLTVTKWIDDKYQLAVEYSIKYKNLVLNSIYKTKKGGLTSPTSHAPTGTLPSVTSETPSGVHKSSIGIISQNGSNNATKKGKNKSLPVVHDSNESLLGTPLTQSGVSSSSSTNIISHIDEKNATNIENKTSNAYNNSNKGERSDDFRRIQEESRRISSEEQQLFYNGSKEIDDTLRERLSRTYGDILSTRSRIVSDRYGLLENTRDYKIYSNVEEDIFNDIFEVNRTYLKNGELVDLHDNYNDSTCYLSDDGLSGFAITKNDGVENSGDLAYNKDNERGERSNGFRRLQEESRRLFTTNSQQERVSTLDDSLYTRIRRILSREIRYFNSRNSNTTRLLENTNNFKIYDGIDGTLFHDCFEIARTYLKNGELVDLHDNYDDCTCYLSDDGLSGFAITKNGDLISVFNLSNEKGFLRAIAPTVVKRAKTLDCYVSPKQNLQGMYSVKFGFKTASIMDYNMDYDHDNIAVNHDMPKVAFMVNTNKYVKTLTFDKDQYDAAQAYQLSFVNKNNSVKVNAKGHDANLVKDSANLRNEKVYDKNDAKNIIDRIIELPDNAKYADNYNNTITRLFEDINITDANDDKSINAIDNAVENIKNIKVDITTNENDKVRIKFGDFISENEEKTIRSSLVKELKKNGKQGYVDKVIKTLNNKIEDIKIESKSKMKAYTSALSNINSLKKEFENTKTITPTGDIPVEEINLFSGFIKGITLTRSKLGISPNDVKTLVNNFDNYNEDTFGKSTIGYNEDIREIIDVFKEQISNKSFFNRELSVDEMNSFNDVLKYVKHSVKTLKDNKTIENIKTAQKSFDEISSIRKFSSLTGKNYNKINAAFDNAISVPEYIANNIGRDSELYKLLTEDWAVADNNEINDIKNFEEFVFKDLVNKSGIDNVKKLMSLSNKRVEWRGHKFYNDEIAYIYLLVKNTEMVKNDIVYHLPISRGIGYYNEKTKRIVNMHFLSKEEKETFTPAQWEKRTNEVITELENLLPKEILDYANNVSDEFFNKTAKQYLSEAVKTFTGIDIPMQEKYIPTSRVGLNNSGISNQNYNKGILSTNGLSVIKKRTLSGNPYKITRLTSSISQYINNISKYKNKTEFIDRFRIMTTKKFGASNVETELGKVIPNWGDWSGYLNKIIRGESIRTSDKFLAKALSNTQVSLVSANPSSALKQLLSDFAIAREVGVKTWANTLFDAIKNLSRGSEIEEVLKSNSGYFKKRFSDNEALLSNVSGISGKVTRLNKVFGFLLEKLDKTVITSHVYAVAEKMAEEVKVQKNKNGEQFSDLDKQKMAVRIAESLVKTTQSNSDPMSVSRLRSGDVGEIRRQIFGMFASDSQNSLQSLKRISSEQKNQEKIIKDYEDKLKNDSDLTEEEKDFLKSKVDEKKKVYNKKEYWKRVRSYAFSIFMTGIGTAVFGSIARKLFGKEDWNEFDTEDFAKDVIVESTIGWMPYVSTIYNAVANNSDISLLSLDKVNNFINIASESISELSSLLTGGEWDEQKILKNLSQLALNLGDMFGVPATNIYKLILGQVRTFAPDKFMQLKSWTSAYSSSSMRSLINETAENGIVKRNAGYIKGWSYLYSANLSDDETNEISRLKSKGFNAIPKENLNYYYDESGAKISLSDTQKREFAKIYNSASLDGSNLLKITDYTKADDETKAKVLKKIYDSYYDYAKMKVTGTTSTNKIVNLLAITNGKLGLSKFVIGVNALSNIEATKNKTRKELVLEKINKMSGYTKAEKLLLIYLCGFTLGDKNKTTLQQYLTQYGATLKDAKNLIS